ncbi:ABC transporter substrate-binding protein [Ramlibacter sp. MMS24-I3-19]|uniref:ABC transporter substrate-binding protein n=1 Tax=Ramlibacter sp. MMS24-I3-19 TaxID=3416606 RepID=UPI003CFE925D
MSRSLRYVAGVLGAALFAAPALAADPILIGVSLTQSPPGSVVQGTQVKDGMEILKDMVNAKGGVLGRQIKLLYEDNQGIPEKGRAATEKLITSDKVVALAGGHQSSVCLAEIEVAHRYKVPYVNTNCWSDDVRKRGYPEVFNTSPYNTLVSSTMAQTLSAMKVKRVVAFAENTDYGIGQAKLTGELLKQVAPNVEYKYETLDRASKDFTAAVLPLRANPPDVIVLSMLPPAAYLVMNQVYEQGVAPSSKTLMYDGGGLADYPDFWQNVKEDREGPAVVRAVPPADAADQAGDRDRGRVQEAHRQRHQPPGAAGRRFAAAGAAGHRDRQEHGPRQADPRDADDEVRQHPRHHQLLHQAGLQLPAVAGHPVRELRAHRRKAADRADRADPGARTEIRPVEDRPPHQVSARLCRRPARQRRSRCRAFS